MSAINILQNEIDYLIAVEKHRVDNNKIWEFPSFGGGINIPLISDDRKENFILDIHKAKINLRRSTFQNRARECIILLRLDIDGSKHVNPDGEELNQTHLHIYKENYGDKWAIPVPADKFSNLSDLYLTLTEFMVYCNIVTPPFIVKDLFT